MHYVLLKICGNLLSVIRYKFVLPQSLMRRDGHLWAFVGIRCAFD